VLTFEELRATMKRLCEQFNIGALRMSAFSNAYNYGGFHIVAAPLPVKMKPSYINQMLQMGNDPRKLAFDILEAVFTEMNGHAYQDIGEAVANAAVVLFGSRGPFTMPDPLNNVYGKPPAWDLQCPTCQGVGWLGGGLIHQDTCPDCKGTGKCPTP